MAHCPALFDLDLAGFRGFADPGRDAARRIGDIAVDGGQVDTEPDHLADPATSGAVMDQSVVTVDAPAADADRPHAGAHSPHSAPALGHRFFTAGVVDSGANRINDAVSPDLQPVGCLTPTINAHRKMGVYGYLLLSVIHNQDEVDGSILAASHLTERERLKSIGRHASGAGPTDHLHALTHADWHIGFLGDHAGFAVIQMHGDLQARSTGGTIFDGVTCQGT